MKKATFSFLKSPQTTETKPPNKNKTDVSSEILKSFITYLLSPLPRGLQAFLALPSSSGVQRNLPTVASYRASYPSRLPPVKSSFVTRDIPLVGEKTDPFHVCDKGPLWKVFYHMNNLDDRSLQFLHNTLCQSTVTHAAFEKDQCSAHWTTHAGLGHLCPIGGPGQRWRWTKEVFETTF